MSEAKHTPEPWSYNWDPVNKQWRVIPEASGYASVGEVWAEHNARRIVACVNACAGLPTEELEQIANGAPFTDYAAMREERDRLAKDAGEIAVMLLQNDQDGAVRWARGLSLEIGNDGGPRAKLREVGELADEPATLKKAIARAIEALSCEGEFEHLSRRSSGEQIDAAHAILTEVSK